MFILTRQGWVAGLLAVGLLAAGGSQWWMVRTVKQLGADVEELRVATRSRLTDANRARTGPANSPPLPAEPISIDRNRATTKGSWSANSAMLVYSDFQCPYCAAFAQNTWPTLDAEYVQTGRVLMVFRHFPLSNHELAQGAAEGVECAGRQGKFWPMHDRLFLDPKKLDASSLRGAAQALGLDYGRFDACLSGQAADQVRTDLTGGKAISVTGTPTFFIGNLKGDQLVVRQRLTGARSIEQFRAALDSVIALGR